MTVGVGRLSPTSGDGEETAEWDECPRQRTAPAFPVDLLPTPPARKEEAIFEGALFELVTEFLPALSFC